MNGLKSILYVIGNNDNSQLGIEQAITKKLMNWNTKNKGIIVKQVKCTAHHTIFIDIQDNVWSMGSNATGHSHNDVDTNDKCIAMPTKIAYFQLNNIQIQKICCNVSASCIFWISGKHKLYGNGCNIFGQLGIADNDSNNRYEPVLINSLYGVLDVQCANKYSIALCNKCIVIPLLIDYWVRNMKIYVQIADDVIRLIQMLYGDINDLYSTYCSDYGGNGHIGKDIANRCGEWSKIEGFDDKKIIQISCGASHSLFLEENGTVWCAGRGQWNLGRQVHGVVCIQYFVTNKIQIEKVHCGCYHSLALGYNGNIWSWGANNYGQCGIGNTTKIVHPKLVHIVDKSYVADIKCGAYHSYARIDRNKNNRFLWGYNKYNECTIRNGDDIITLPHCLYNRINGQSVKDVYLGYQNTIIITQNDD